MTSSNIFHQVCVFLIRYTTTTNKREREKKKKGKQNQCVLITRVNLCSSQSQLLAQTPSLTCVHTQRLPAIACNNIYAHLKDPVVHVRVRWIMETLKHPESTVHWAV